MASPRRLWPVLAGLIVFAALAAEAGADPKKETQAQSPTQALTLSLSPARTPVTFTRKEENVVIGFTVDSSAASETPGVRLLATPFVDDQGRPFEMKLLVNNLPSDPQKV